jgi:hypothetical protein
MVTHVKFDFACNFPSMETQARITSCDALLWFPTKHHASKQQLLLCLDIAYGAGLIVSIIINLIIISPHKLPFQSLIVNCTVIESLAQKQHSCNWLGWILIEIKRRHRDGSNKALWLLPFIWQRMPTLNSITNTTLEDLRCSKYSY